MLIRLKTHAPQVSWVGSIGIGICSTAREYYEEPALAMMIGAIPAQSYRLVEDLTRTPLEADLVNWWKSQQACFALLHGDPANPKITETLQHLGSEFYTGFLNGGLSSSRGQNHQILDKAVDGGLSGILFNERVEVLTDHTQGCSPIGPVHNLTESRGNIAIRIDSRPALDVLKEDIGEVMSRNLAQSAGYIFTALPIPGSDTGDYLVRNLMGIDEERGMLAIGDYLDEQNQLMFCRRDGNSATEDMLRMLQRLKGRLGDRQIRGGIYISCLGRGRYQFGDDSEELKMIRQELGAFPLVGFFANGEIYNARLYGYTGVLTLFV
jgi:small ligand-binding sensory domain FIST